MGVLLTPTPKADGASMHAWWITHQRSTRGDASIQIVLEHAQVVAKGG